MEHAPNPVVREVPVPEYPGWVLRERRDGTWDAAAVRGVGLSPGFAEPADAFDWLVQAHAVFPRA